MRAAAAVGLVAVAAVSAAWPQETEPSAAPRARGGLAWVFSPDVDLLGRMGVEIPWSVPGALEPYAAVDAATTISKTASGFTFLVHDLVYGVEAGARVRVPSGPVPRFFVDQRGRERADAPGRGWFREIGAGAESPGWGDGVPPGGFVWSVAAGAVTAKRDAEAEAFARGGARFTWPAGRVRWGADLFADGVVQGGAYHADLEAGPRLDFPWGSGRRASLYLHGLRGRHPLGLGIDALAAGFEVAAGPPGPRAGSARAPDVRGVVGAAGGDGYAAARFQMKASSPTFGPGLSAVLDVDANARRAPDGTDLYYLYDAGVEGSWRDLVAGGWFYHRSNHVLDAENTSVTSLNVLEAGVETPRWDRAPDLDGAGRWSWLDVRLRAGFVVDSAFGAAGRLHVRGGIRAVAPTRAAAAPFVSVEGDAGEVSRLAAGAGVVFRNGADVRVEYSEDDELYSAHRSAWLLRGSVRY